MTATAKVVQLRDGLNDFVLVRPGEYTAVYIGHKGCFIFRERKLRVDFRLVEHLDLVLQRWYRVVDYRGGRIRAIRSSDLVRELSAISNRRIRHDRIPIADFEGKVVRVEVRTVRTDSRQRKLATVNEYSVIARVLERVL
jgi:hypothetical protein